MLLNNFRTMTSHLRSSHRPVARVPFIVAMLLLAPHCRRAADQPTPSASPTVATPPAAQPAAAAPPPAPPPPPAPTEPAAPAGYPVGLPLLPNGRINAGMAPSIWLIEYDEADKFMLMARFLVASRRAGWAVYAESINGRVRPSALPHARNYNEFNFYMCRGTDRVSIGSSSGRTYTQIHVGHFDNLPRLPSTGCPPPPPAEG